VTFRKRAEAKAGIAALNNAELDGQVRSVRFADEVTSAQRRGDDADADADEEVIEEGEERVPAHAESTNRLFSSLTG